MEDKCNAFHDISNIVCRNKSIKLHNKSRTVCHRRSSSHEYSQSHRQHCSEFPMFLGNSGTPFALNWFKPDNKNIIVLSSTNKYQITTLLLYESRLTNIYEIPPSVIHNSNIITFVKYKRTLLHHLVFKAGKKIEYQTLFGTQKYTQEHFTLERRFKYLINNVLYDMLIHDHLYESGIGVEIYFPNIDTIVWMVDSN